MWHTKFSNFQIFISSTPVHAPLRIYWCPTAWFGSTTASADMKTRDGKLSAVYQADKHLMMMRLDVSFMMTIL
jgi:hypothetical protein